MGVGYCPSSHPPRLAGRTADGRRSKHPERAAVGKGRCPPPPRRPFPWLLGVGSCPSSHPPRLARRRRPASPHVGLEECRATSGMGLCKRHSSASRPHTCLIPTTSHQRFSSLCGTRPTHSHKIVVQSVQAEHDMAEEAWATGLAARQCKYRHLKLKTARDTAGPQPPNPHRVGTRLVSGLASPRVGRVHKCWRRLWGPASSAVFCLESHARRLKWPAPHPRRQFRAYGSPPCSLPAWERWPLPNGRADGQLGTRKTGGGGGGPAGRPPPDHLSINPPPLPHRHLQLLSACFA